VVAFLAAMIGILSLTSGGGKRIGLAVGATWAFAILGWLAVLTGMLMMARYNARPPAGATDLAAFPRALLMSKRETAPLHVVGMVWKVHVSWIAPMLATAVAAVLGGYGVEIADRPAMRRLLALLLAAAFAAAAIAGVLGLMITKAAPLR
jgi:hypothetical protein